MQRALRKNGIRRWLAFRWPAFPLWLALGLLIVYAQAIGAQVAIPALRAPVTDLSGTLDAGQIQQIESELRTFEARKGSQIAVLIVPTTQPETIEQYSIRVAESWKLGRKGIDDGVLLLVAKDDRAVRIEVGYGLEGSVPDAIANRIIDETLVPQFRQGNFYEGIRASLDKLIRVIDGEPLPPPSRQSKQSKKPGFDILHTLFVLFVFTMVLGGVLRALFGRIGGATATGLLIGLLAWMFIGAFLLAGVAAAIAFVISLLGGVNPGVWSSGGGGIGGGNFGRGGWSGGSGGWSGGGGGFGGGGASGRW